MDLPSILSSDLPLIEEINYEFAISDLKEHVNDVNIFNYNSEIPIKGAVISEDMQKKVRRQSHYIDCIFVDSDFYAVGLSGSKFIDCSFKKNHYTGANMSSCIFQDVKWIGTEDEHLDVKRISFNRSVFTDCVFIYVDFNSSRFMNAVFYNCSFIKCKMKLCALENTLFNDCIFDGVDFRTGNMSFSTFNGIQSRNSVYSFHSLNFTFGLLKGLAECTEQNYVYSASREKITFSEYINLFSDFETYYIHDKKYFPLANIYSFQNKEDLTMLAMKEGLRYAIQTNDFRMLKYYSKLAYVNDIFNPSIKRWLFDQIQIWVEKANLSTSEIFQYQLESQDIRRYLLMNNYQKPTIYIDVKTNIDSNELERNSLFIKTLEHILQKCDCYSKSTEYKHNSDFSYFLTLVFDNLDTINHALFIIYGSLGGFFLFGKTVNNAIGSIQNMQLQNDEHQQNKIKIEKLHEELEFAKKTKELDFREKELEIQKKEEELRLLIAEYQKRKAETEKIIKSTNALIYNEELHREIKDYNASLQNMGITMEISHTSENIKIAPFPETLQYHGTAGLNS